MSSNRAKIHTEIKEFGAERTFNRRSKGRSLMIAPLELACSHTRELSMWWRFQQLALDGRQEQTQRDELSPVEPRSKR
jgi:hypothetical protein